MQNKCDLHDSAEYDAPRVPCSRVSGLRCVTVSPVRECASRIYKSKENRPDATLHLVAACEKLRGVHPLLSSRNGWSAVTESRTMTHHR